MCNYVSCDPGDSHLCVTMYHVTQVTPFLYYTMYHVTQVTPFLYYTMHHVTQVTPFLYYTMHHVTQVTPYGQRLDYCNLSPLVGQLETSCDWAARKTQVALFNQVNSCHVTMAACTRHFQLQQTESRGQHATRFQGKLSPARNISKEK